MVNEAYTRNTIETCTYGDAAENPCYLRGVNCVCKESLDQMAQSPVAKPVKSSSFDSAVLLHYEQLHKNNMISLTKY